MNGTSGNVGIGTTTPSFKLDVNGTARFNSQFDIYGTTRVTHFNWGANGDAYIRSGEDAGKIILQDIGGNVGIGTTSPSSKLEVNGWIGRTSHSNGALLGSYNNVGPNGVKSNPIYAIGSAYVPTNDALSNMYGIGYTHTSAPFISATASSWGLYVAADGDARSFISGSANGATYFNGGNVGIGTTSPQFPLHVTNSNPGASNYPRNYIRYAGAPQVYQNPNWSNDLVSIYANGAIMSNTYIAASDKRIKDITGISKSKDDLSNLLAIEVTDYKMKDKVKYGEKTTKKVIAQQLKSVYPQAVSLQTDVIPDIYKVSEIKEGYIKLETDLKKGDKVKLIFEDNEEVVEVLSTDKNGFTVNNKNEGKVFVFGKQVDDFHVVDYDAVSMLNVSATQELYKLILKQQKTIEKQKTQISAQIEESKKTQSNFDERIKKS
jgi:hypothetical protein